MGVVVKVRVVWVEAARMRVTRYRSCAGWEVFGRSDLGANCLEIKATFE